MSTDITEYPHVPLPFHLAGVRRLGLALTRWAERAAERRNVRSTLTAERAWLAWQQRADYERLERQREAVRSEWQLRRWW